MKVKNHKNTLQILISVVRLWQTSVVHIGHEPCQSAGFYLEWYSSLSVMTYTRPIVYLIHIIGSIYFKVVYFFVSFLPIFIFGLGKGEHK
jgi:hypothetical protein